MEVGSWEVALVIAKWCMLLATAGAIGGPFVLALARKLQPGYEVPLHRYLQKCGLAGLLATALMLLLSIGAVNRGGLGGMFDTTLGAILLQSGSGEASQVRMFCFALLLVCSLPPVARKLPLVAEGLVQGLIGLGLVAAFNNSGHVSTLSGFARAALGLHVLAAFLWIGALYPLLQLCSASDAAKLQDLMRRFGMLAAGILAILIVAGVYLATQLLQQPLELLTTAYGRLLLLKLLGVYALLMFAAINKWLLVPRLVSAGSAGGLYKSIRMEWIVAMLVLAVTSWLTTLTSPVSL